MALHDNLPVRKSVAPYRLALGVGNWHKANMAKKAPAPRATIGRPSSFTEEVAAVICARIAAGESLRAVCRDPAMPEMRTVFRWMPANEGFRQQYEIAMEARAAAIFDEMMEIADTPVMGETTTEQPDGSIETKRGDMIQHRRLQIDARKWMLARMSPKKYGDRLAHEVTGEGGGAVMIQVVTGIDRNPGDEPGK